MIINCFSLNTPEIQIFFRKIVLIQQYFREKSRNLPEIPDIQLFLVISDDRISDDHMFSLKIPDDTITTGFLKIHDSQLFLLKFPQINYFS